MKISFLIVFISSLILLASCSIAGKDTPVPFVSSLPSTLTPKPSVSPMFTITLSPTTHTDLEAIFSPTLSPESTKTLTEDEMTTAKNLNYLMEKCQGIGALFVPVPAFISPDSQWAFCQDSKTVQVFSVNGTHWTYPIVATYSIDPLSGDEISGEYWTNDHRYFYFRYIVHGDGGYFFGSTIALWRMDLTTGKVDEVLRPTIVERRFSGRFMDLSFSPSGRRLAYIYQTEGSDLNLVDMKTGALQVIPIPDPYTLAGVFLWQPNGTSLILEMAGPEGDYSMPSYYGAMLVDLIDLSSILLVDHSPSYFRKQILTDDNVIFFNQDGYIWNLNFHTRRLGLEGTPTPTSNP
jgi:hypothetical protein